MSNTNTTQTITQDVLNNLIEESATLMPGHHVYCSEEEAGGVVYQFFKENYDKLELRGLTSMSAALETSGGDVYSFDGEREIVIRTAGYSGFFSVESHNTLQFDATLLVATAPDAKLEDYVLAARYNGLDVAVFAELNAENVDGGMLWIEDGSLAVSRKTHYIEGREFHWFSDLYQERAREDLTVDAPPSDYHFLDTLEAGEARVLDVDVAHMIPADYPGVMSVPLNFLASDDLTTYRVLPLPVAVGRSAGGAEVGPRIFIQLIT